MTDMPPPPPVLPGGSYPEPSKATLALVLSILGLCCWPTAIAGIVIANTEKQGIANGRRDPGTGGTAQAAFVIGIVMVAIGLLSNGLWFLRWR